MTACYWFGEIWVIFKVGGWCRNLIPLSNQSLQNISLTHFHAEKYYSAVQLCKAAKESFSSAAFVPPLFVLLVVSCHQSLPHIHNKLINYIWDQWSNLLFWLISILNLHILVVIWAWPEEGFANSKSRLRILKQTNLTRDSAHVL